MRSIRFSLLELLLAVPFVGLYLALIVYAWNEFGPFFLHTVVYASIVLPLSYLVFVLMVRQYRERSPFHIGSFAARSAAGMIGRRPAHSCLEGIR